jgi:hypothetical protein
MRCLHGPQPEHRARRLVTYVLARAGITSELDDAEVAVNELVTKSVQGAGPVLQGGVSPEPRRMAGETWAC